MIVAQVKRLHLVQEGELDQGEILNLIERGADVVI
jgi:hypothetical protein